MVVYRFLSFFDLYNILEFKRLRFRRVSTLDDKNEGLGLILRSLQYLPFSNDTDEREIKDICEDARKLAYVSCWCQEPENIAMWSLYSPDKSSFRVATTKEQLLNIINTCWKNYENSENKKPSYGLNNKDVLEMKYMDLQELVNDLKEKNNKYITWLRKYKQNDPRVVYGPPKHEFLDSPKFRKSNPWCLKDKNYTHESEVRALIEFRYIGTDFPSNSLYVIENLFSADFYVSVPDNFIHEICFDNRYCSWKREVYKDILSKYNVEITESSAFNNIL
ncbi:hypothetical protein HQ585_19755 [candidate division KSB1 bacterium]|nr:hypothetical protein [candidate division KSB1 bacterium]